LKQENYGNRLEYRVVTDYGSSLEQKINELAVQGFRPIHLAVGDSGEMATVLMERSRSPNNDFLSGSRTNDPSGWN